MLLMINKKAISPLIATLLLIAFTVALGVMIMNFGKNIVNDYGGCDSIDIEIDPAPNSLCYKQDTQEIAFTLRNNGKTDISSIVVRTKNLKLQGPDRIKDFDIANSAIPFGGYLSQTHPYIMPELFEVSFIPKLTFNSGEQVCTEQAIKVTSLDFCA